MNESRIERYRRGPLALSEAKAVIGAIEFLGGEVQVVLASGEWNYKGAMFQLAGNRQTGTITTRSRRVRVGSIGLEPTGGSVLKVVATFGSTPDVEDGPRLPIELDENEQGE